MTGAPPDDPILVRRAQVARWAAAAKRGGYAALTMAVLAFVVGAVTNFEPAVVGMVVGGLVVSALLLIPAIIFGYGVSMAESEERGEPFRH